MKAVAAVLMFAMTSAFASGYGSTAKLQDGKTLLVMPESADCGGKPSAAILDKKMMDLDHTCIVEQAASGVTVVFQSKPMFVPAGQLKPMAAPPKVGH